MVNGFLFARSPEIHFGPGKIELLPSLAKRYGRNILLITGARSFAESIHFRNLMDGLKHNKLTHSHIKISGEPSPQLIDSLVNEFILKDVDLIIAVGGGSVLDTGKAVAAMLSHDGFAQEYLEGVGTGRLHPGRKLPFIAVPTTAGTGSEATKNAVLSSVGDRGFKKSLRHESFVPDIALVDPALTVSCPADITAACGLDAFTQLLESLVSVNASPMTEALCLSGLEHIKHGLLKAIRDPEDVAARTDMSYAALVSGLALANAGLGTVHGFASVIGGYYAIPHGIICGTLMSAVTKTNIERLSAQSPDHPALAKYIQAGKIIAPARARGKMNQLASLVSLIEEWTEQMRIPTLGQYGVQIADLDRIVAETDQKYNPVKLSNLDLTMILKERL